MRTYIHLIYIIQHRLKENTTTQSKFPAFQDSRRYILLSSLPSGLDRSYREPFVEDVVWIIFALDFLEPGIILREVFRCAALSVDTVSLVKEVSQSRSVTTEQ